jgi:hypothetical protein
MAGDYLKTLEEKEGLLHCPTCTRDTDTEAPYRAPHQRLRYWIITFILHLTAFLTVLAGVNLLNHPQSLAKSPSAPKSASSSNKPVDHNAHLIGTPLGLLHTSFPIMLLKTSDPNIGSSSQPSRAN